MKKDYIVRQNDIKDCGVCCLESIFKYYDGYIPIETLRIDTNTNTNGTTAYNIIKTAKKYGLNGIGKKLDSLKENQIILPAIAHLELPNQLQHFVVIYKITKKHIYVMDPAKGYKKYKIEEFYNIWTKVILQFIPYKKIPSIKKNKTTLSLLKENLVSEKYLFSKLIFQNILIILLSILTSYYFKIIASSIENNYINATYLLILIFLIINILKIYITHIKNEYVIYLEKNIDLNLTIDFISHIFKLPLNVIKSRTSGEILTRVNELNNIKTLFIDIVTTIFPNVILAIISIYFLYSTSNELFLILCIISLLYIITGILTGPVIYKSINDNIDLETEFNSNLVEKIEGIESIKYLSKTNLFIKNIVLNFLSFKQNDLSYKNKYNIITTIKSTIYEIGLFIITSIGFILIINQKLTLINLITFNTLLSYFLNPIIQTINILPSFYFIKLSIIKITEFYQAKEETNRHNKFVNGDIEFKNVEYSYSDFKELLKNINFKISKNEHVHLVGNSGCGKSTLCKLLNKTITEHKGDIYIDNKSINKYSVNTLRDNIVYVSQREKLFSDTIINNIKLDKKIDNKRMNKILSISAVDKILEQKEFNLDTFLYDGAFNLSGGERQRIILARALAQQPDILILDESLSELDKKTELRILKELDKHYKNTTIIYISHSKTKYFKRTIHLGEKSC